jgi:hypothetical protein
MAALVGPAAPRDPAAAEALARALAGGLGDARVRRTVHQAWRNSQVSAHKLVLQEFVGTPEGRLLVEAAARSSGTSVGGIRALIGRLPAMDFYVPRREDRRTWRGTADVGVYATVEEDDAQVQGYTVGGQRLLLAEGRAAAGVAVLLAPAEPKGRRVDPQPVGPGEVIEDATDGTRSGSIGHRGPDGEWLETDLADWAARLPSAAVAGPLRPHLNLVPGSTSYLVKFFPRFGDGAGFQDCEVRYILTYYPNGTLGEERRFTDYNVPCPEWETDYQNSSRPEGYALSPFEPVDGSGDQLRLRIVEIDEWDNDDFGYAWWGYRQAGSGKWNGPTECYPWDSENRRCYRSWGAVLQW